MSPAIIPQQTTIQAGLPIAASNTSRILCVWFPNWPIQRLVVQQPELRRQQVVLFRRDSRRGQLVSAASPLSRQIGVCPGMPLSEAKSLLRRGSNEEKFLFEHDLNQDTQAIEQLCKSLESFSPIVGLETIDEQEFKKGRRPSALLLDITGLAHLFGDEKQLARQLLQHLESIGYLARAAIADTVGAAWAAAHFLSDRYFHQHQQPLVITAGDSQQLLSLPVEALRLDDTIADTLHQLGIRKLSQLLQLSRDDLAMRFGSAIHLRMDQLLGATPEPVVALRTPAQFMAEQLLEYPTRHRETIEVIISRLIEQLCRQLRSQQQGSLQWQVCLQCSSGPINFSVSLFQPSTSISEIMPLVEMQLEIVFQASFKSQKKRKLVRFEVNEICVTVASHVLLVQQQRDLFNENPRLDKQSLSHLINRLAGRLGTENVVYPTLQSGAQPEYSYRLKPLVDARRKHRRQPAQSKPGSHRLARPIRLCHPPVPIKAELQLTESPASKYGSTARNPHRPPAVIAIGKTSYQVEQTWGPERIETGWWRGPTVCRDYWRIAVNTGQQFWIYRDLRRDRWWLHGEF
jgi:protein ImuB